MDHVARHARSFAADAGLPAPSRNEFPASRSLAVRLADALRRRAACAWRGWTIGTPPPAIETAFDWLGSHDECSPASDVGAASPAETGASMVAAVAYGADDLAGRWRAALLWRQLADGGFPRPGRTTLSLRHTAYALRGLLAAEEVLPSAVSLDAIARAAEALIERLAALGDAPAAAIEGLPPLRAASALYGIAGGARVVAETLRRLRREVDFTHWDCPLEDYAARLHALWELRDLADEAATARLLDDALALPGALQRRDGGVPDRPTGRRVSVAGTARLAMLWLQVGQRERASRALDYVAARVPRLCRPCGNDLWVPRLCQPCGVEPLLRWRRSASTSLADIWTAAWFLLASRLRVAAAFDGDAPSPPAIHPADGRWLGVEAELRNLPAGAAVADVGCGSGRYLRLICERFPALRLVGIDPSAAALGSVPRGIETRRGDLLRLPARDGEFDAALCVEALEHALLPRRAVAELCRVVRPDGRIVVIDKDAALQSLSHHQPWERWFSPDEVSRWLAEHGAAPTARHILHGVPARDPRLFVAWTAVRAASCAESTSESAATAASVSAARARQPSSHGLLTG